MQVDREVLQRHGKEAAETAAEHSKTVNSSHRSPRARIVVHVEDSGRRYISTKTFINPPKVASTVLERLREMGFSGDLQDSDGNSLSSTDPLDDSEEYRLTCATGTQGTSSQSEAAMGSAMRDTPQSQKYPAPPSAHVTPAVRRVPAAVQVHRELHSTPAAAQKQPVTQQQRPSQSARELDMSAAAAPPRSVQACNTANQRGLPPAALQRLQPTANGELPAPHASCLPQQADSPQAVAVTLLRLKDTLTHMSVSTYMDATLAHHDDAVRFLKKQIRHAKNGRSPCHEKPTGISLTLLHVAACCDDAAAVQMLIAGGCNVNDPGYWGFTPLHVAIRRNSQNMLEVVRVLVEAGATANTATGVSGWTPLHQLSDDKHSADTKAQLFKLVFQAGADVHAKAPPKGNTALHVAAGADDETSVRLLLESGADVNALNTQGQTPLDLNPFGNHHSRASQAIIRAAGKSGRHLVAQGAANRQHHGNGGDGASGNNTSSGGASHKRQRND